MEPIAIRAIKQVVIGEPALEVSHKDALGGRVQVLMFMDPVVFCAMWDAIASGCIELSEQRGLSADHNYPRAAIEVLTIEAVRHMEGFVKDIDAMIQRHG